MERDELRKATGVEQETSPERVERNLLKAEGEGVNLETLFCVLVFWVSRHALECVCTEPPKGESSTYMLSCLALLSAL